MSDRRNYATMPDLRMNAYYFCFEKTGVREIDEILSAVACAGKSYHHTDDWNHASGDEPSWAQIIQEAADRAAEKFKSE